VLLNGASTTITRFLGQTEVRQGSLARAVMTRLAKTGRRGGVQDRGAVIRGGEGGDSLFPHAQQSFEERTRAQRLSSASSIVAGKHLKTTAPNDGEGENGKLQ